MTNLYLNKYEYTMNNFCFTCARTEQGFLVECGIDYFILQIPQPIKQLVESSFVWFPGKHTPEQAPQQE